MSDPIPVDTLEAPHEPAVRRPGTARLWAVLLAGPAMWITHFAVVYLLAEAACRSHEVDEIRFLGPDGLEWAIAIVTLVAVVALVPAIFAAIERRRSDRLVGSVALILAVGAIPAIVAVALPVVWLVPC